MRKAGAWTAGNDSSCVHLSGRLEHDDVGNAGY